MRGYARRASTRGNPLCIWGWYILSPSMSKREPTGLMVHHPIQWWLAKNLLHFQAIELHTIEKDIAAAIKKHFDEKFKPTWHCIVGKNFGAPASWFSAAYRSTVQYGTQYHQFGRRGLAAIHLCRILCDPWKQPLHLLLHRWASNKSAILGI